MAYISRQILAKFYFEGGFDRVSLSVSFSDCPFAYDFHYLEFHTEIQIYVIISCSKSLPRVFLPLISL